MTILFFDEIYNFLIDMNISNSIILGDFNFNYFSSLFPHTEFKYIIYTLSLKQNVDFPTHIHGNCLDLILTHDHLRRQFHNKIYYSLGSHYGSFCNYL